MGISLIGTTADGEALGAFMEPPVVTGLEALFFTGVDETRSRKNRAGLMLTRATKVGSPTFSSDRMSACNYLNCLELPIVETDSMTIMVACKADSSDLSISGNRPALIGMFNSGSTPQGVSLHITSGPTLRAAADYSPSGVTTQKLASLSPTQLEMNTPRIFAMVVTSGVGHTVYDLTKGTSASVADTSARVKSTRNLRVGGSYSSGTAGPASIYGGMISSSAWNLTQLGQNADWMARFLSANRGVTGLRAGY